MQAYNPQQQYQQFVKSQQISEMCSFYRETSMTDQNAQCQTFRIPLKLSASKTPLWIQVYSSLFKFRVVPAQFPNMRPTVQILANVEHPDIHPTTKIYEGKITKEWGPHSKLLQVIRFMHSDFERQPPKPASKRQQEQSPSAHIQH